MSFREYINTETVKLAFEIDINKEFQRNNEINCNINSLILVPEFVYNYFIIKIKNNQHTLNYKNEDEINDNDDSFGNYDYMKFKNLINLKEPDESANNINEKIIQNINSDKFILNSGKKQDDDETNSNEQINNNKKKKKKKKK